MFAMHSDSNAEDQYVIIPEHIPLAQARKLAVWETGEPYLGQRDKFSEWAVIRAFSNYKVGDRVPFAEFFKLLLQSQQEQELANLVELGLIEAVWDPETGQTGFRVKR